jgi:L-serine dehydratase
MNSILFFRDIVFNKVSPFHSNGMKFTATLANGKEHVATFYSLVVDL